MRSGGENDPEKRTTYNVREDDKPPFLVDVLRDKAIRHIPDAFAEEYSSYSKIDNPKLKEIVFIPAIRKNNGDDKSIVSHILVIYPKQDDFESFKEVYSVVKNRASTFFCDVEDSEKQRLLKLLLDVAGTLDLKTYLNEVVALIQEEMSVEACSVFIYVEICRNLRLGATSGLLDTYEFNKVRYSRGQGATGRCFSSGQPVILNDINGKNYSKLLHKFPCKTARPGFSFLAIPIRSPSGAKLGVLRAVNRYEKIGGAIDNFSNLDLDFIQFIGRLVGYHMELHRLELKRNDILKRLTHEIHSPISSVRVTAEYLRDEPQLPALKRTAMLSDIVSYASLLDKLSEGVARFVLSKTERIKRYKKKIQPLDEILEILNGFSRPLARMRGRYFDKIYIPNSGLRASIDRDSIIIVLLNMLSNSIKYFDPGGQLSFRVDVSCSIINSFESPKSAKVYETCLVIEVSDYGIGIDAEDNDNVFEPGFRTKEADDFDAEGQGLGLSLVKLLVEDLQGEVYISSNYNPTTFTILLPQPKEVRRYANSAIHRR